MIKWEGERASELEGSCNDREGERRAMRGWELLHGERGWSVSDRLCICW